MPAFDLRESELSGVIAYIGAGLDPDGIAIRIGDAVRGLALFREGGLRRLPSGERSGSTQPLI